MSVFKIAIRTIVEDISLQNFRCKTIEKHTWHTKKWYIIHLYLTAAILFLALLFRRAILEQTELLFKSQTNTELFLVPIFPYLD